MEDLIKSPNLNQKKNSISENSFKLQNDTTNDENIINDFFLLNKNLEKNFLKNKKNLKTLKILISQNHSEISKKEITEIYIKKIILSQKIQKLTLENKLIKSKIEKLEKKNFRKKKKFLEKKKKRIRKLKGEIIRNFKCETTGCKKSYGSENSLNQHIKLKHNNSDFYQKKFFPKIEENIFCEEKEYLEENKNEDFFKETNDGSENQFIDFEKIVDNLWIE